MTIVVPTTDPLVKAPYVDDDVARFGEVPSAKELEIRTASVPVGEGTLVERRLSVTTAAIAVRQSERIGRQLHALTSVTGWVADADVSVAAYSTTAPTGYSGDSLEIGATGGSAVDRGAAFTLAETLDLTRYGGGALLRVHRRCTSVTNLAGWKLRLGDGTGYLEGEIVAATEAIDTWDEAVLALQGLTAVSDPDLSAITKLELVADVAGAYTGELEVRDLRLGTVQTAKDTPDGHLDPEATYDIRVRYRDDVIPRGNSTLAAAATAGATNVKHTDGAWVVGDQLELTSADGRHEIRTIAAVGNAGSGGTGLDLAEALSFDHLAGEGIAARYLGPWSSWLTVKASEPPVVGADTPADAATLADPTPDLVHTFSSPAGKTQARVVTRLFERGADDALLWSAEDAGTALSRTLPALLLRDGGTYAWEKVAYDTDGLSATSPRRSFDLSVGSVDAITGLVATADPSLGAVVLVWVASTETYLDHYRIYWLDDTGSWVRVDGGPVAVDDGRSKVTDPTFTHYGARLGLNEYAVTAHLGSSDAGAGEGELEAATASAALGTDSPDTWVLAAEGLDPLELTAVRDTRKRDGVVKRFHPPGRAESVHQSFGLGPRSHSLEIEYLPDADGDLSGRLGSLVGSKAWLKAPAGWRWDPWYCVVTGTSDAPQDGGRIRTRITLERTAT